jgi:hypothetical protein
MARAHEVDAPSVGWLLRPRESCLSLDEKSFYNDRHGSRHGPAAEYPHKTPMAPPPSRMAAAWDDLVEGSRKSWMWSAMAMQDIKLRYRGTVLGSLWLTIRVAASMILTRDRDNFMDAMNHQARVARRSSSGLPKLCASAMRAERSSP